MSRLYSSPDFEAEYTYHGDDLGATWSAEKTCFRLWAPTADTVNVKLYRGGDASKADILTLWTHLAGFSHSAPGRI